jgi:hypothetical protein
VGELPAVARMLLSMRGEIEAARALVFETGKWVDRLKAYEQALAENPNPDPTLRQKQKQAASLAEAFTPLVKYYATEMGNRVCYKAMQVHGGVGYMREFNVERHYRDIRVTNIYEGTSQLQIVAVLGKLLGRALDPLLDEWIAREDYPEELEPVKVRLVEATALLRQAGDALKARERELIDFYAADLVDMAVYLVNAWLLLLDGGSGERKRDLARIYAAEHLPHIQSAAQAILAADAAPLQARNTVL